MIYPPCPQTKAFYKYKNDLEELDRLYAKEVADDIGYFIACKSGENKGFDIRNVVIRSWHYKEKHCINIIDNPSIVYYDIYESSRFIQKALELIVKSWKTDLVWIEHKQCLSQSENCTCTIYQFEHTSKIKINI